MGLNQEDTIRRHLNRDERNDLKMFGRDIKAIRQHAYPNSSLREVSVYLAVNPSTLSMVETGQLFPAEKLLRKMVEMYMTDHENRPLTMYTLNQWLPKRRPSRGRQPSVKEKVKGPKWEVGRKLFAMILKEWMAKEGTDKLSLAGRAEISLIHLKQLLSATHPIPPNDSCRRLAKALNKKPLKLLLLRMISMGDPEIRSAIMKKLWPWSIALKMMGESN